MPYLKFDKPKHVADNKASCSKLVNYLAKEDEKKGLEKEFFFNHLDDCIPSFKVIEAIDNNKKGLMNIDAKFYSGSLNFSQKELAFLNNDAKKLKQYMVEVIKEYAHNFNKNLSVDDINWFAKVEYKRYYHGTDKEVLQGKARQGEEKPGLNTHIHFIIGRKSADGKRKLSPQSNHRNTKKGPVTGGFDRDRFKNNCELIFDAQFWYNRSLQESYGALKIRKNGTFDEKQKFAEKLKLNDDKISKFLKESLQEKQNSISNFIDHLNINLTDQRLNKNEILNALNKPYMSSAVYKSLINLRDNIDTGKELENPTKVVLNYAEFLNNSIKDLPAGLREDKIRRACYELQTGQKGKKWNMNIPKIMDFERSLNFTGRLINDIIQVSTKLNSKQDIPISGPFKYLFANNFISYGGENQDEEEKKRKKRKKKLGRDNDYSR